jgi:hypothetical protein
MTFNHSHRKALKKVSWAERERSIGETPGSGSAMPAFVSAVMPAEWRARVAAWQKMNRKHRVVVDGQPVPGPNEEYLLYQTLIGTWPILLERLQAYLLKVIHEAKLETSWINPAARYDQTVLSFAEAVLDPARSAPFLADFTRFQTDRRLRCSQLAGPGPHQDHPRPAYRTSTRARSCGT